MTCLFNLLPQCPALSVPVGLANDGLPVGLQMVGRRYADEDVLSLGGAIERVAGFGSCGRPGGAVALVTCAPPTIGRLRPLKAAGASSAPKRLPRLAFRRCHIGR